MSHAPTLLPEASASDVAFTPSVKAIQARKGSRRAYYALWVEYGAKIPAHKIVPSVAQVLAFQMGGKAVFAKAVMTKPAILPAQQPIHGTFKDMRKEILSDLRKAVEGAL